MSRQKLLAFKSRQRILKNDYAFFIQFIQKNISEEWLWEDLKKNGVEDEAIKLGLEFTSGVLNKIIGKFYLEIDRQEKEVIKKLEGKMIIYKDKNIIN